MTIKELYDVIGGNYEDLMTRIPKENMIERFVRKYVDCKEFDKLAEAYEAKDYKRLFETSHNLKGMSANLSFSKINKTITEICEAVRKGEPKIDLSELMATAQKDYELLVNTINQLN